MDVHSGMSSRVDELFAGFNVSLLAYGQTATGKTHTMFGAPHDPGLVELLLAAVYQRAVMHLYQLVLLWFPSLFTLFLPFFM